MLCVSCECECAVWVLWVLCVVYLCVCCVVVDVREARRGGWEGEFGFFAAWGVIFPFGCISFSWQGPLCPLCGGAAGRLECQLHPLS
jgi:hypothetical protein